MMTTQASEDDFNNAKLIALSHNLPSIKVSSAAAVADFLEDDGGY